MGNWLKVSRWVLPVLAVVMMVAVSPVAYGGLKWSGIDPRLAVDGHDVEVAIAVPPGQWCNIAGPIGVVVTVSDGADAVLLGESSSSGDQCDVTTETVIVSSASVAAGSLEVEVQLKAGSGNFLVEATVTVDGVEAAVCSGHAKTGVSCPAIDYGS